MTTRSITRAGLIPHVRELHTIEVDPPHLTPEEESIRARMWEETVAANPAFFDGPTVICPQIYKTGPYTLHLSWYRSTYSRFLLRDHGMTLPSLFVTVVQPTDDGRLLMGRADPTTAAPGRWQLPGGNVEPPPPDTPLDLEHLRTHALRELAEETGGEAYPDELHLWSVTRGSRGSIGIHFLAPSRPAGSLLYHYRRLVDAENALGRAPELSCLAFLGEGSELPDRRAEYMKPLTTRFFAGV